jgi:hypothetical protein
LFLLSIRIVFSREVSLMRPTPLHRPVFALVFLAASILLLATCGEEGGNPVGEGGGGTVETIEVSLGSSSAMATDRVEVTGIPETADGVYAEVEVPGDDSARAFGVVERTESGDFLIVPLNPAEPGAGGSVEIAFTGSGVVSNLVTLEIDSLPPAPGAFADVVGKLQHQLDGWLAQHGTTREELRNADPQDLSPAEIPLLLAHNVIDRPDNPNSLRALADGDIPLYDGTDFDHDVLDRIIAKSRIGEYLDDMNGFVDTLSTPTALGAAVPPAARVPPSGAAGCIAGPTFGIGSGDCRLLSELMRYQASLEFEKNSATQKIQDDAKAVVFSVLGFTPLAPYAAGTAATMWAADQIQDGAQHMYPSHFISEHTDYDLDPDLFPEDFIEPGTWSNFRVTAASDGWKFDKLLFETVMQTLGAAGGSVGNVLTHLKGTPAVKSLTNFIVTEATNSIISEFTDDSDLLLEVCPQTWPDVDCTGEDFSEGSSAELTVNSSARTYEPSEVGTAALTVETLPIFGAGRHTAETKEIETRAIEVFIDPFEAQVETDTQVDFTARVENALNTDVSWRWEQTQPKSFNTTESGATLVTPDEPWSPAIQVWARSLANTGLRAGKTSSDPREDMAPVTHSNATVLVEPPSVCLQPNEEQPFQATVIGAEDQSVTWSTEPPNTGSFEDSVYTAPPSEVGDVLIIATSVANSEAEGYAHVVVAGCTCYWTASVTGHIVDYWSGPDAHWWVEDVLPSGFHFDQIVDTGDPGSDYPLITGSANMAIGPNETGTWEFGGVVQPTPDIFYAAGDPDSDDMPEITLFTNDGTTVEGMISGPFFRIDPSNPENHFLIRIDLRFKGQEATSPSACEDQP